jgi:hypothetical protein
MEITEAGALHMEIVFDDRADRIDVVLGGLTVTLIGSYKRRTTTVLRVSPYQPVDIYDGINAAITNRRSDCWKAVYP